MPSLPKDVYPESGFRLPLPKREELDEKGKQVYDKLIVELHGPAGINLHSPKYAEHQTALNRYLRFESGISGAIRELAILVMAREMDCQFEWSAHEPMALRDGLPQEIIDIVKFNKGTSGLPETEAVVIQFGREMFRHEKVSSETFALALKVFGAKQLVDLVALMSSYVATALKFRAFDLQLAPHMKPLLPPKT